MRQIKRTMEGAKQGRARVEQEFAERLKKLGICFDLSHMFSISTMFRSPSGAES